LILYVVVIEAIKCMTIYNIFFYKHHVWIKSRKKYTEKKVGINKLSRPSL